MLRFPRNERDKYFESKKEKKRKKERKESKVSLSLSRCRIKSIIYHERNKNRSSRGNNAVIRNQRVIYIFFDEKTKKEGRMFPPVTFQRILSLRNIQFSIRSIRKRETNLNIKGSL